MNHSKNLFFILRQNLLKPAVIFTFFILQLLGCGPKDQQIETNTADDLPKVKLTADDFYHPELIQSEFTDEVDEQRFRAIGNSLKEVNPKQKIIYFVGKLRKIPTQAQIKVLWFNNNIEEPVLTKDIYGSDTFSFISSFTPPGRKFMPGDYTVRVIVNGKEAGSDTFVILGEDPFKKGITISQFKIAKKVNKNGVPVKPAMRFKSAVNLNATFKVSNVMSNTDLTIKWYRGDSIFNESVIHVNGNGRFSANIGSSGGLPSGAYTVEIEKDGATLEETKFAIGNASMGPTIDYVALGDRLGSGQMPQKNTEIFKSGTGTIFCGLRFLDLYPDSEIAIDWVMVEGNSETVYYSVNTPVPGGGSGSMSAKWDPEQLYAGNYKAVIYINNEIATEKEFKVK
ncbi:MAG: hypothetical protein JXR91_12180 [Deltaproteobacteria bacterium]|nr:hypothetical protein [Deltaproteobacteria bacterium]